ncbi:glycosyl hydrolase family 92-domain-containing protein [Daedaleopsis nitida]|nr:glycosyl hydrolase family 92-domain-containing protein [Daedaleopsis nitida]
MTGTSRQSYTRCARDCHDSSVYTTHELVTSDIHSEAASRTLDNAYDDFAVAAVVSALSLLEDAAFFRTRVVSVAFSISNKETGFMEAKNANGSWADPDARWTEGDMWAYTFDALHDLDTTIERKGGTASFPSHHIPYLYVLADAASKFQGRIREIAAVNHNNSVNGLSGEDWGQMSAWYIFSVFGLYSVSVEYLPDPRLSSSSPWELLRNRISSVTVNGQRVDTPILKHADIAGGGEDE